MADRIEDVAYARHGDVPLLARIYRPAGAGPFPAVVDVHGGAWIGGDRTNNATIATYLAAMGIVVASIDIRKPPVARYPASVADVNAAVRWLKAHARRFGSRPELVGSIGTSSGGHLTLLNALRPGDTSFTTVRPIDEDEQTASVAYTVACWPVSDPSARYAMAQERNLKPLLTAHHAYWPTRELMDQGNPIRILERGAAQQLPDLLLIAGTADENLPADLAQRLAAAYGAAGGSVTLEEYEGEPHAFVTKRPDAPSSQQALSAIATFVHRCGSPKQCFDS